MKLLLLVGLILVAVSPAAAQRVATITYHGPFKCGDYLEDRQRNEKSSLPVSWVYGYISAYNRFGVHAQVQASDPPTVSAYLEKYCRDNPLKDIAAGTNSMITELGGRGATR